MSLVGGDAQSIASSIMEVQVLKEAVFTYFLQTISDECNRLCQTSCTSLFRAIPVTSLANIKWVEFIAELGSKAPILLQSIFFLVSVNDTRNTTKVGAVHFPGICATVAVLLKERCREMCGVQSLVSVLMYACHCEKQVYKKNQDHTSRTSVIWTSAYRTAHSLLALPVKMYCFT